MLGRTYERENCSAARALEVVGERWSLLIIRDAMFGGARRFTDFERSLGIASNVLAARLELFTENGLMESRRAADGAEVREYVLTARARDLEPVILALSAWGDTWAAPNGAPIVYRHRRCESPVHLDLRCDTCGDSLPPGEIVAVPGPGLQ
ncbi:HxlR family transcriptional regulator [Agromyces sp. Root1464]|uniref:winged helix-turn-helix transcriptional regulator n=1 Tax=Agromyces sp. Root1464 TaxID=1736467 RepID=UPI0006F604FA|nr:helix-turn-helix domain-containing protein [Agromyces sp. Root1464]KQZ08560.1 HxlR family transcriptional regulator [Agromyces sp. Root1464]